MCSRGGAKPRLLSIISLITMSLKANSDGRLDPLQHRSSNFAWMKFILNNFPSFEFKQAIVCIIYVYENSIHLRFYFCNSFASETERECNDSGMFDSNISFWNSHKLWIMKYWLKKCLFPFCLVQFNNMFYIERE